MFHGIYVSVKSRFDTANTPIRESDDLICGIRVHVCVMGVPDFLGGNFSLLRMGRDLLRCVRVGI